MIEDEMDRQPVSMSGRQGEAGFTLIDVLFVVAMIGVLCSIAIPRLMRSRAVANESTTIAALRSVHTAQLTYAITCGGGMYADSFPTLGVGGILGGAYLSNDLTNSPTPSRNHYTYTMAPGISGQVGGADCNGTPTITSYYVTAVPDSAENGTRAFATNQDQAIWQDVSGTPPIEPFTQGGTVATIQ